MGAMAAGAGPFCSGRHTLAARRSLSLHSLLHRSSVRLQRQQQTASLEAIKDLKPLSRTVLPPSEHGGVSVYALTPNGKES